MSHRKSSLPFRFIRCIEIENCRYFSFDCKFYCNKNVIDHKSSQIPTETPLGVPISESCISLISGLLKRNLDERMSYEDFLNHPFVDIEHSPSSNSLNISVNDLNHFPKYN